MRPNWQFYFVGGLIIVLVTALGITNINATGRSNDAVQRVDKVIEQLNYNAIRGDCIRDKTAASTQQYNADIAKLLDLSFARDTVGARAVIATMRDPKQRPSYADIIAQECPPALKP